MRILAIILILFCHKQLCSCSCVHIQSKEKSNLEFEIEQSDWIGIGTIIKSNTDSYPAVYHIEIRILYKESKEIKSIQTGLGGPDCGFIFEVGKEYVVYGNTIGESSIETNRYSRTNEINNSSDYDYLNKKFLDNKIRLDWSESFTNYIQSKIGDQIDMINPPLIISENYNILTVENTIVKHPNYYIIEELIFNPKEINKMNPKLMDIAASNRIVLLKSFNSKIRKRKLIRILNSLI